MQHNDTWKAVERAVAAALGGRRISNHALGLETPDVETDRVSVEVKHRKTLPMWLCDAMRQARDNATPGKLPVVVLHQAGQRHSNDIVCVRLADFAMLMENDSAPGDKSPGAL